MGRQQSIEALLAETHRGIVPIRKVFVQQGHGRTTRPGPLATFLRSHDDRGLEAYLFLHAMASAAAPYNCVLSSGVWVRVLGLAQNAELRSARGAVSKIMKRLADRKLVERSRTGRKANLALLCEDGSKTKYERLLGKSKFDRWLQLPHAYWLEGHYTELNLPAKVILLIALSLDDGFPLPQDRAWDWYGISADSADEGLRELVNKGLLRREYHWEDSSRSDTGWTKRYTYTPIGSFSKAERKKASVSRRPQHDDIIDLDESEDAT